MYWGGSAGCAREKICFPLLLRLVLVFGALDSSLVLYTDSLLWLFSLNEQELIQFGFNLWELLGSLFNWCTPWFWWRSYTKHVVPKKVRVTNGYALAASSTMSMHLYARVIYVIKLLICDICHAQTQSSSNGTCTQIIHIVYIHHLNINIYIHIYIHEI